MPLTKYIIKNKRITNILFVSTLLPYLLLCLTLGGFHNSLLNTKHCNHRQHPIARKNIDTSHTSHIEVSEKGYQHDSETCQICQWLKTPSSAVQFLTLNLQFDFVYVSSPRNFNPILPSLSIHKFTIRPPPFSSCFSA